MFVTYEVEYRESPEDQRKQREAMARRQAGKQQYRAWVSRLLSRQKADDEAKDTTLSTR